MPTGFRRLTPGLLKADRTAEGFAGLPEGVTAPGQLLAAFKAAAPHLGIAPRLVHALDWLFRFTQPQDWEQGSRPIVWPSARMQQEALGLSPTQVKETNRRLIELGLVTHEGQPERQALWHARPEGPHRRSLRLRSLADCDAPCRICPAGGRGAGPSAWPWAGCAGGRRSRARASSRSSRPRPNTASRVRSGRRSPVTWRH